MHRLQALVLAGLSVGLLQAQANGDVHRTVYFTATARGGTFVGDLTAADVTVEEAGKAREILRLEPSRARLKVCLAVDEGLAADLYVRRAAIQFAQQLQGAAAEVSIYLLAAGSVKLADYTSNPGLVIAAIQALPRRAQGGGRLVESLFQLTGRQGSVEGRRVIVLLATEAPERNTMTANGLLDVLRDTGAVLHVSTLAGPPGIINPPTPDAAHLEAVDEIERDRALNEGAKQSGGLRLVSLRTDDFPASLDRIRGELLHEYQLTYVVAAGSKSDGRLQIGIRRRGVTARGPRRVPALPSSGHDGTNQQ